MPMSIYVSVILELSAAAPHATLPHIGLPMRLDHTATVAASSVASSSGATVAGAAAVAREAPEAMAGSSCTRARDERGCQ